MFCDFLTPGADPRTYEQVCFSKKHINGCLYFFEMNHHVIKCCMKKSK